MTHKVQDLNRRNISFSTSKVKEVLPEYFAESYPNLVTFLEKYYDYLEGENTSSFKREINNLFVARDPGQVDLDKLDFILREIGNGTKSSNFFQNPRLMTQLLARFYRVKGSLNSIEGFFRGFFGEEIVVEYPKRNMFIVGESEIGYESLKFIQDNRLYQIFSILIKTALSNIEYNDLYLRFVHPAGFYYASQVTLENQSAFNFLGSRLDSVRDEGSTVTTVFSDPSGFSFNTNFAQETGLLESDGVIYRSNIDQTLADFDGVVLDRFYSTIDQVITPNSFTFDDSSNSFGPDMSLTIETMDNNMFTIYLDSSEDSFY